MSSDVPPPPRPAGPPPGWYPTDAGQRWWDGQQWGPLAPQPGVTLGSGYLPAAATGIEQTGKTAAIFAHVGYFLLSVILALILRQTEGEKNAFVKHHATEALNFQLSVLIVVVVGMIVSAILAIVSAGLFLIIAIPAFIALSIYSVVISIIAAVAANRGEWYRYPVSFRMVEGARPPLTPAGSR